MSDIQIIKKDGKAAFAVVPIGDYERLCEAAEDAEDARSVREFDKRLAQGDEELLPAAMVDSVIDGEATLLKAWRNHRKITATSLAKQVGISAGYYSELESGAKEGSIEVWRKIAATLNVGLDDLLGV